MPAVPLIRRLVCWVLTLGLALAVRAEQALEPVKLQLPYMHQFQFAGCYAAEAQGYFAAHGLQVELLQTDSDHRSPIEEVLKRRAQFGIAQGPLLVASRLESQPVLVLAAILQHSPQVLVSLAADNIRTPHDLVGKRVALDQTSRVSEIRIMLQREGVDLSKIEIVQNQWVVDELRNHTADAQSMFVIDGPYDFERAGIKVNVMRPVDYGVDFYGDCLFTTEQLAREHPETVEAMRQALLQGWEYALKHPEEMIELILKKYAPQLPYLERDRLREEARQVARLINADLVNIGHMNEGRWRVMAEITQAERPELKASRLEGFLYVSPDSDSHRFEWIYRWLRWGLVVALAIAALALLATWRLRRLVDRRTRELMVAEQRQREYFDLAPVPIVIEDYTAFEPILARFRAEGITDLRAHLGAKPELISQLHLHKRIVAANRQAMQRSGYNSKEDMHRILQGTMNEQAMDMFVEELLALWNDRENLTLEKTYVSANGEAAHMLINWEVSRRDGKLDHSRVRLVFTDVTQQKKIEQSLRESEARYRQIFEDAPIAVVEFDYGPLRPWFEQLRAQGVARLADYLERNPEARAKAIALSPVLDINSTALKLIGARNKSELVQRLGEVFTENTVATRLTNISRVWDGVFNATGETELRRLDGQIRKLSFHWQMHGTAGDPTYGHSQVVLSDVTERLVAEKALRDSEARYRELFEQAAGGIYRTSPDGQFLAINSGLARIFGFTRREEMLAWVGESAPNSIYVKPGRRREFIASLDAHGQLTDFESEVRFREGTGWISENTRVVRDSHGNVLYYEGFVTDITARRHLEAEMGRASKLEAVGLLAGGIAHDFNNILTVVLGNITLAETETAQGSPLTQWLQEARRATLRARDLTLQLLTFAKGGEPVKATIELPELLRESTGFSLHGAKARADFNIAPGLWSVHADKGQLGQVMQNLVINAVQAMPDGGVIAITAKNHEFRSAPATGSLAPGRYVQISVADTGVGIPRDNLAKIFDPYFTTKAHGSGLGLATCYSIIKKHAGHIEAESQPGRGTVFHLWLPAGQGESRTAAGGASGSNSPFRVKVLFMDDEVAIRSMADLFMQRLGYHCDAVADGAAAIEKYREAMESGHKYQVVLMDLTVPGGMGGREAMEQLRRLDPAVCAIVSSGYSRDPVMSSYRAHGFKAVLPKPYGLEDLRRVMQEVLEAQNKPA